MPFVPLEPEEEKYTPCTHREHNPPAHMVIRKPMKWVCPGCGASVILLPPDVRWHAPKADHIEGKRDNLYLLFDGNVELGRVLCPNKDAAEREGANRFPMHIISEVRRWN